MASIAAVAAGWWWLEQRAEHARPKRIGIIQLTEAIDAFPDGMKDGLAEFGYVEGRDVVYEYENIEQDVTKAPAVAQRYVSEGADIIYAITNPVLAAALDATKQSGGRTSIVFVGVDRPVETGLIESFTSSGNNSTGIMGSVTENVPKQVALLREMEPKAKVIGIFGEGFTIPGQLGEFSRDALYKVAPEFGFTVKEYASSVSGHDQAALEAEFRRIASGIKKGEIDAVFHLAGHWNPTQQFLEIELGRRLAAINVMPTIEEVTDGGTYGYAPDLYAAGKDSAIIIDKLLRGQKPEHIPVEYPRHNVLWVNLDSARKAGIAIPDSILSKADRIIGEDGTP